MCRSTRITRAILFFRACQGNSFPAGSECEWTGVMRRREERQMSPGRRDPEGCLALEIVLNSHLQTLVVPAYALLFPYLLHTCRRWPGCSPCQLNAKQINLKDQEITGILIFWQMEQKVKRGIILSSPIGDDLISASSCSTLLSVQEQNECGCFSLTFK